MLDIVANDYYSVKVEDFDECWYKEIKRFKGSIIVDLIDSKNSYNNKEDEEREIFEIAKKVGFYYFKDLINNRKLSEEDINNDYKIELGMRFAFKDFISVMYYKEEDIEYARLTKTTIETTIEEIYSDVERLPEDLVKEVSNEIRTYYNLVKCFLK